jgi:hypothetical protein
MEIEPLRRIGYSLTQNQMQTYLDKYSAAAQSATNSTRSLTNAMSENSNAAILNSNFIGAKVTALNDAQKEELRYVMILEQSTLAQGDMARTLNSPANQLRILRQQINLTARAIGNIFIPALNKIVPVAIALLRVIRNVINAIANLFGFTIPEVDYSGLTAGLSDVSTGADDVSDGLDDVGSSAKKAKEAVDDLLGPMDELHILQENTDSGSGSGGSGSGGTGGVGDLGGDLFDSLPSYDMFSDAINDNIDAIQKKIEDLLPWIAAIATEFAAWKIGSAVVKGINAVKAALEALGLSVDGLSKKELIKKALAGTALVIAITADLAGMYDELINGADWGNVGLQIGSSIVGGIASYIFGGKKLLALFEFADGLKNIAVAAKELNSGDTSLPVLTQGLWGVLEAAAGTTIGIPILAGALGNLGVISGETVLALETAAPAIGLAVAAIGVAVLGLSYLTSDALQPVDAFAGKWVETTDEFGNTQQTWVEVSETTKEAVGSFLDTFYELVPLVEEVEWSKIAPTDEQVAAIADKLATLKETVLSGMEEQKESQISALESLNEATGGAYTDILDKVNTYYENKEAKITDAETTINSIMQTLAEEGRTATEEEQQKLNDALKTIGEEGVTSLTSSAAESELILSNLKNNTETLSTQAAAAVIKAAKERHDTTIELAQEEYDSQVQAAEELLATGQITADEYDQMCKDAKTSFDDAKKSADDNFTAIKETAEEKMGEMKNAVDTNTGESRTVFEKWFLDTADSLDTWVDNMKTGFGGWKTDTGTTITTWVSDYDTKLDTFFTNLQTNAGIKLENVKTKFKNIKEDLKNINWLETGKAILDGLFNGIFNGLGTKISSFVKDFKDKVKSAFEIHSPSKLMETEVGYYVGSGIVSGMQTGVDKTIKGAMSDMKDTLSELVELGEVGEDVAQKYIDTYTNALQKHGNRIVQAADDVNGDLEDTIDKGATDVLKTMSDLTNQLIDKGLVGTDIGDTLINTLKESLEDGKDEITNVAQDIADSVQKVFNGISYDPNIDYQALINQAEEIGDTVSAAMYEQIRNAKISGEGLSWEQTNKYEDMYPQVETISKDTSDTLANIKSLLDTETKSATSDSEYYKLSEDNTKEYVDKIIDSAKSMITDIESQLKTQYTDMRNMIQTNFSEAISAIKNIRIQIYNNYYTSSLSSSSSSKKSTKGYATGGFPSMGDLFVANEAGAEMVGTIGSKTAVVNNDQIVQAVSQGVAQAVSAVMSNQNQQPIDLYLDGEKIYSNQQKVARNKGVKFNMGAFAR